MIDKKTKIICTIADNRCDEEFIRDLYENGMNVVRINSAHATIEGAGRIVENVRKVSDRIAILIDTKGPEVRLTQMADSVGFVAHTDEMIEIIDDPSKPCTKGKLYTTYPHMAEDVPVGSDILIDDGSVDLAVIDKEEGKLICKVMNEGLIKGHKSVNVPNVHINLPGGRYDKPGYKADCHLLFTARELNFGKSALSLTGGPGAVVGYTHNTKGKYGVIAGVSGTFQATLRSGSPLSLSLGFTAMLGCHMSSNPVHGSTLEFHSLGVRYAYIPEITIRYRFL